MRLEDFYKEGERGGRDKNTDDLEHLPSAPTIAQAHFTKSKKSDSILELGKSVVGDANFAANIFGRVREGLDLEQV